MAGAWQLRRGRTSPVQRACHRRQRAAAGDYRFTTPKLRSSHSTTAMITTTLMIV